MNFDFSDDQRMLRDHARRFLSETCDFPALRAALADGAGYQRSVWEQIIQQGWQSVAVDEALGGLGLGMLELCVLSEELGRSVAAVPFFTTVSLGTEVLKRCPERSEEVLAKVVTGTATLAVSLVTPGQDWSASALQLSKGSLSGQTGPLAYAAQADYAVLPALDAQSPVWVVVDLKSVQRIPVTSFDPSVPFARLVFDSVPATELCRDDLALNLMSRIVDQAAVLIAFEQLGGAERALGMARDYALNRHTFGRPIGAYQAVKHRLADMAVKIELARSNAYYGAWALEGASDETLGAAAALARISASDAFEFAAEECLHLHGGIGYTWEADCHFLYKRARVLGAQLGPSSAWIDRLLSDESLQALHS